MILVAPWHEKKRGLLAGFTVKNHGESFVCAAVSMLVLNTVNSIEALTDARFSCNYQEEGGFVSFSLDNPAHHDAGLLLRSMMLGLESVRDSYPDEISIESE